MAGFLKNVLNDRSEHIQKSKIEGRAFDVALTRNSEKCGSDEDMRWLALHPFSDRTIFEFCPFILAFGG